MEGQKTRVKNEIGETREQSSLQMFCFDTFNSGYSFSSNFILLLTKTVSAKKMALRALEDFREVFISEHPRVGRVLWRLGLLHSLGTTCKQGPLVPRSSSPRGGS